MTNDWGGGRVWHGTLLELRARRVLFLATLTTQQAGWSRLERPVISERWK